MNIKNAVKAYIAISFGWTILFVLIFASMVFIISVLGSFGGNGGSGSVSTNGPSGTNWVSKDDVSLDGIRDTTMNGLQDLANWYKEKTGEDLLVTSGTDGTMHAGGERGSHYSGDKLDVASDALENEEFRQQFIEYAHSQGILVLDEYAHGSAMSTGGHLDLNFQGYHGSAVSEGVYY